VLDGVRTETVDETDAVTVYNIHVHTHHTYYVLAGDVPVLVHNAAGHADPASALRGWRSERFQFGAESFSLDRRAMKHFLVRHHPTYWNGSTKASQSFFDASMSVDDIHHAVGSVMRQNRDRLIEIGGGIDQVEGVVDGVSYVVGVTRGRIGQFYPGALKR
ncbi:hypothetical protein ACFT5B_16050, partial [Luteimicrobium sp. NPDC057192]|uniref:hypothetical protein n=1 Tax=Luteimicrobium sp. NPDC057192 TaxID=3346042 RepID=UPI003644C287